MAVATQWLLWSSTVACCNSLSAVRPRQSGTNWSGLFPISPVDCCIEGKPCMARMFGTDGIRGTANVAPVSPEIVMALGRALVHVLAPTGPRVKPALVVGRDTRLSSPMLEAALTAGMCAAGADVLAVGVLPTPGVALISGSAPISMRCATACITLPKTVLRRAPTQSTATTPFRATCGRRWAASGCSASRWRRSSGGPGSDTSRIASPWRRCRGPPARSGSPMGRTRTCA